MLDVPKNTTCPASDGFEFDSNSGNEAPNPGDGELPMGFMIRVYLQSSILNTFLNDDTNAPNPGWVFSGWWRVKYVTLQKASSRDLECDNPDQITRMPHSRRVLFSEQ